MPAALYSSWRTQLLVRSGNDPSNKHVVCGRSNIVGKPLAAILMQKAKGANGRDSSSYRCQDISYYKAADILVAAMVDLRLSWIG